MGRRCAHDFDELDDYGVDREPIRRRSRPRTGRDVTDESRRATRSERRAARRPETEGFRCRHCKAMVGPTLGGGRHRNHCPICLHSRHVDESRPGDRASRCRALMAPIGVFVRRSGEQVLVHRCLGCGIERWNRIAADDHPLVLMALPLLPPPRAAEGSHVGTTRNGEILRSAATGSAQNDLSHGWPDGLIGSLRGPRARSGSTGVTRVSWDVWNNETAGAEAPAVWVSLGNHRGGAC